MTTDAVALQADLNALTSELLSRYEEVTLLYDLTREMGVVVDLESASQTVLARSLQVIPARFGVVLAGRRPAELSIVATYGEPDLDDERLSVAFKAAREAMTSGSQVMLSRNEATQGDAVGWLEPVLAAPLQAAEATADRVASGALAFVGHAATDRFSAADAQLAAVVAGQLWQGLENARMISELREKERLESDLQLAAEIQRSLLPQRPPEVPGVQLAAACRPAAHVGGDYYDFVCDSADRVTLVVADVSGHGVGSGLIIAMTRGVLRAELRRHESLGAALEATNAVMWDDLVATETYITLFAAQYEPHSGQVRYVNAGHPPALLRRADTSTLSLGSGGLPFGILPDAAYEVSTCCLRPGDSLTVVSDGVVEADSPVGEPFGLLRLRAFLETSGGGTAQNLVDHLLAELADHRAGEVPDDDVTVVALTVNDSPSSGEGYDSPR